MLFASGELGIGSNRRRTLAHRRDSVGTAKACHPSQLGHCAKPALYKLQGTCKLRKAHGHGPDALRCPIKLARALVEALQPFADHPKLGIDLAQKLDGLRQAVRVCIDIEFKAKPVIHASPAAKESVHLKQKTRRHRCARHALRVHLAPPSLAMHRSEQAGCGHIEVGILRC